MSALVMAYVTLPDGRAESEPVIVTAWPDALELVLDDGTRIVVDAQEFENARSAGHVSESEAA